MEVENGWLKILLEKMDQDISEIRKDIALLREFRWKLAGGVTGICALITVAINVIAIWVRI